MDISRRAVYYWVNSRPKKASQNGVGRPCKLSARSVRWVKEQLVTKKLTCGDVQKKILKNSKGEVNVSRRTVQRAAKKGRKQL